MTTFDELKQNTDAHIVGLETLSTQIFEAEGEVVDAQDALQKAQSHLARLRALYNHNAALINVSDAKARWVMNAQYVDGDTEFDNIPDSTHEHEPVEQTQEDDSAVEDDES